MRQLARFWNLGWRSSRNRWRNLSVVSERDYGTTTEPSPNDLLHLNEPLMDHREGQLFLTQAFKVIMEEMLWKGTDVNEKGAFPFLVHATSRTTVQGAFDPLEPIADICDRQGLWMHVDNLLKHCHSANTTYLFQQDKFYDMSLDTGDKSIQCGRKVDCLNLWLMWKAVGSHGLAERVDRAFAHTSYLVEEMQKLEGFQLIGKVFCSGPTEQPEFVNVCFWFIPPSLRGKENSPEDQNRLSEVSPVIKERMMQGTMMVSYQPQGGRVNFFRMIVVSPQLSQQDMICFLDEIERLGNDL